MIQTANQPSAPIESPEIDDHAAKLIDALCQVMHQCSLDGHDFDFLLSSAFRRYFNELVREQAEERSLP
jgi:hypothetical protein